MAEKFFLNLIDETGKAIIPNGVTEISYGAYYHCTRLSSIVIPAGVKKICEHAFEGCTGLTSIVLPDGVTEIGYLAFSECPSLEELDFTLCRDCYGYEQSIHLHL